MISQKEYRRLGLILLLAAGLRLPGLGSVPPPLNQDEASRGYDAWCLAETGADRWGARWPLFLRSFGPGDYTAALSTYLIVPFVAWLGPSVTAFRLPAAILGVLTIPGLLIWLRRTFDDWRVAWLAALLLAVSPWHVTMTRTAHEAALVPFFVAWGLAGLAMAGLPPWEQAQEHRPLRRRLAWAALAGGMFAMAAWVYPATRMLVPVLLAAWLLLFLRGGASPWRDRGGRLSLLALAVALSAAASPLWITLLRAPEQLAARAKTVSIFSGRLPPVAVPLNLAYGYALEFGPIPLWWDGDNISGAHAAWFGRMLHVEAPLALVGFVVLVSRARRCPRSRFLLLCLLLHPLPAAICNDWNPHPMRPLAGALLWPAISAMGAMAILSRLAAALANKAASRLRLRVVCAAFLLLTLGDLGWCAWAYVRWFPAAAADSFQENLVRAFQEVGPDAARADFVLVTEYANQPYIYTLLFAPIPPKAFARLRTHMAVLPGPGHFDLVTRVGNYFFVPYVSNDNRLLREALESVRRDLSGLPRGARGLAIEPPGSAPPGRVLRTLLRRNGSVGLEIREVVIPP